MGRGATSINGMKTWNRPLLGLTAASAVLTLITLVGVFVDPRILTGAPIWLKPFKFAISFTLYGFTLAWMLSLLPRRRRAAELAVAVIVAMTGCEMAIIVTQVIRGTTSHFNESTPFDTMLFATMGVAITLLFLAHLAIGVAVLRARIADRVAATAVRLGLGLSALGMLVAVPMVIPRDGLGGAHSVGTPDGGPGLPLFGWSTVGGDLRIGHFVGLHGLQALPLLGLLLNRYAGRLTTRTRIGLLLVAGGAYGALTLLLTWQALRGQPLLRPDAVTLAALAALIVATVASAGLILARDRRTELALAA